MVRVVPVVFLSAAVGVSAIDLELCADLQSVGACHGGKSECTWSNSCDVNPSDPVLHPFLDLCKAYGYKETSSLCKIAIEVAPGSSDIDQFTTVTLWTECEEKCNKESNCYSFSVTSAGRCRLCTDGQDGPDIGELTRYGYKHCVYCDDFNSNIGLHIESCTAFDGRCTDRGDVCHRICDEKPYNADGSCSNFCDDEHSMCKTSGSSTIATYQAECEVFCSNNLSCEAYAFSQITLECVMCGSNERVNAHFPDNPKWIFGRRTCSGTKPTTLPMTEATTTLVASTSSTTLFASTSSTSITIDPTESMVEPAAAALMARVVIGSKLQASEAMDSKLESVQHSSAMVFAVGLVVGMTTTLSVIFMAGRRQSAGRADSYSVAEF